MSELKHHTVKANGIAIHVAEQGSGPLVLLCHGWPELWYSWRHQLPALAAAGFRAVAPDMRGFGATEAPAAIEAYSILDTTGDMVALVAALGETRAVIVGHDWGAPVAWHCALFRPDLFRAVAALSVPYRMRGPAPPLQLIRAAGMETFYWIYFQTPGVAEAEFERDPHATHRRILFSGSGDNRRERGEMALVLPKGGGFLDRSVDPETLPAWLTPADIGVFAEAYGRSGFRGGLNWYRNIDRNWALTAAWAGAKVQQPALFIAGSRDAVITSAIGKPGLDQLESNVPNLRRKLVIDGAGHWIQQERPDQVNAALIEFLRGL